MRRLTSSVRPLIHSFGSVGECERLRAQQAWKKTTIRKFCISHSRRSNQFFILLFAHRFRCFFFIFFFFSQIDFIFAVFETRVSREWNTDKDCSNLHISLHASAGKNQTNTFARKKNGKWKKKKTANENYWLLRIKWQLASETTDEYARDAFDLKHGNFQSNDFCFAPFLRFFCEWNRKTQKKKRERDFLREMLFHLYNWFYCRLLYSERTAALCRTNIILYYRK